MTIGRRALSLHDCRTRDDAERRVRAWLEAIGADALRRLQTDILTDPDPDPRAALDIDTLDEALAAAEAFQGAAIDATVADVLRVLDRASTPGDAALDGTPAVRKHG